MKATTAPAFEGPYIIEERRNKVHSTAASEVALYGAYQGSYPAMRVKEGEPVQLTPSVDVINSWDDAMQVLASTILLTDETRYWDNEDGSVTDHNGTEILAAGGYFADDEVRGYSYSWSIRPLAEVIEEGLATL